MKIIAFDIDSISLKNFTQLKINCDSVEIKEWKNENMILKISDYKTPYNNYTLRLKRINIESKNEEIELIMAEGNGLEYLRINEIEYNPAFESRLIGLDEAKKRFNKEHCR